jgi:hypothetical protein
VFAELVEVADVEVSEAVEGVNSDKKQHASGMDRRGALGLFGSSPIV